MSEELYEKNKSAFFTVQNINISNFIKKYKDLNIMLGPNGVSMHKTKNKLIIFFEDIHESPNKECQTVIDADKKSVWIDIFLKELFEISPSCIDFFLETTLFQYIKKNAPETEQGIKDIRSYNIKTMAQVEYKREEKYSQFVATTTEGLHRVGNLFSDCVGPLKTGCDKYKNIRFHNIEFRRFYLEWYNVNYIFSMPLVYMLCPMRKKCEYPNDKINIIKQMQGQEYEYDIEKIVYDRYDDAIKKYISQISKMYSLLIDGLLKGNLYYVHRAVQMLFSCFDDVMNIDSKLMDLFEINKLITSSPYLKLSKQLSALNPDISKKIYDDIMRKFKNIIEQHIKSIKMYAQKIEKEQTSAHTNIKYIFIEIMSILMHFDIITFDAYTLARLMKAISVYDDTSIIIVYAGNGHIDYYLETLPKIITMENVAIIKNLEETEESEYKNYNNCIDTTEPQWQKIMTVLQDLFKIPQSCSIKKGLLLQQEEQKKKEEDKRRELEQERQKNKEIRINAEETERQEKEYRREEREKERQKTKFRGIKTEQEYI